MNINTNNSLVTGYFAMDYREDWDRLRGLADTAYTYYKRGVISLEEFDRVAVFVMHKGNDVIVSYVNEFANRQFINERDHHHTLNNYMSDEEAFVRDLYLLKERGYVLNDFDASHITSIFVSALTKSLTSFLFICFKYVRSEYLEDSERRKRFISYLAAVTGTDTSDKIIRNRFAEKCRYCIRLVEGDTPLSHFLRKRK